MKKRQGLLTTAIFMALVFMAGLLFLAGEASAQQGKNKAEGVSGAREISKDGRFIAYDNGTVLDTQTNLMWAANDNGSEINQANAKSYCENYRGGGYTDWRMPTQNELAKLYDPKKTQANKCETKANNHIATDLIHLSCYWVWASDTNGSDVAAFFRFDGGRRYMNHLAGPNSHRALPVRSVK
ncbi:MAG: DUF1566 domain-containing protein [Desulfobacteraceae bacterium]|nr:MAG: DUF1566 domain-containing protein [Desulfobacteraceae bacterium]